ncbi:MAG: rhodanese-like domain-containing protein [Bacteroidales bacterium]|nr:rhodanese-like domain-containing protein [Bacteroidales bacterium]
MNPENGIQVILHSEALVLFKQGARLIDIRPEWEFAFKKLQVSDAINIPYYEIPSRWQEISRDGIFVLCDSAGVHSRRTANALLEYGFKEVYILAGGFIEWERGGLPVITDISEKLSGSCMCQLRPRFKKK